MSQKRSYAEASANFGGGDNEEDFRSSNSQWQQQQYSPSRPYNNNKRPNKNKKNAPTTTHEDNLTWVRKRARTIERLLAHKGDSLPADVRRDLEREVAAHRQRVADAAAHRARSRMIQRYHAVRFYERKKATRLAKQLAAQLAKATETDTDTDEAARLRADLHIAEVDIDYARYFPLMERYVSMYAAAAAASKSADGEVDAEAEVEAEAEVAESRPGDGKKENAAAQALRAPRPPLWKLVEETREQGREALERLRDRQSVAVSVDVKAQETKKKQKQKTGREPHAAAASEGEKDRRREEVGADESRDDRHPFSGGRYPGGDGDGHYDEHDNDSDGGGFFEPD